MVSLYFSYGDRPPVRAGTQLLLAYAKVQARQDRSGTVGRWLITRVWI